MKSPISPLALICAIASLGASPQLQAEIKPSTMFADHMVLQREISVPIWGTAAPSEQVEVVFAGQTKSATADAQGKWLVKLDPMQASAEPRPLVVKSKAGAGNKTIADVLVGEVWLCAGDASMGTTVAQTAQTMREKFAASFPNIRLFRVAQTPSPTIQTEVAGNWTACSKATVDGFPALPYLFAKELSEKVKMPVGIVVAAHDLPLLVRQGQIRGQMQGATIESFMSEAALKAEPAAAPLLDHAKSGDELKGALRVYDFAIGDWKLRYGKALGAELRALEEREPDTWFDYVDTLKKGGKEMPPTPPQKPTADSVCRTATHVSSIYNGMIAPIAGYAVRGIAWSQGVANATRANQYRALFPALIRDWRQAWGNPELPFIYLQQWNAYHRSIDPRVWAELREAQSLTQSLPKVGMVVTVDLPVKDDVIPADVPTLASRLTQAVRNVAYGEPVTWRSPKVASIKFENGKAIVQFEPRGCKLSVAFNGAPVGFALAERPKRWVYADATIDGDKIIVSHPKLKNPAAVRYNWLLKDRVANVVNQDGLPVEPFRSDDWQTLTNEPAFVKPNVWAETRTADLYPVIDPTLPRVVIIGDSIMNGYARYVMEALEGKANVVQLVSAGRPSLAAIEATRLWRLDEGEFAVIHYNDGLHSMPPIETDEQFETGLRNAFTSMKKISPHVIWGTITPAPIPSTTKDNTLGPNTWNPSVIRRNAISKKVAAETGVEVNDLYELVIGNREQLQIPNDLHFKFEGSKLMGDQVAAKILAAMKAPAK